MGFIRLRDVAEAVVGVSFQFHLWDSAKHINDVVEAMKIAPFNSIYGILHLVQAKNTLNEAKNLISLSIPFMGFRLRSIMRLWLASVGASFNSIYGILILR